MNQQEKTQFILDITENLRSTLLEQVDKMPEEWDGVEIRQLLTDLAASKFNYHPMSRARKRAYKNTVMVNYLD